jgi:hypothetical protein
MGQDVSGEDYPEAAQFHQPPPGTGRSQPEAKSAIRGRHEEPGEKRHARQVPDEH